MSSSTIPAKQREQRTLLVGALVVISALLVSYAIVPFALHWRVQSAELESARARLGELSSLVASSRAIDSAAGAAERTLESGGRRVFRARSMTLAASALQSFLQDASDASNLVVTRLDVAADPGDATIAAGASDSSGGPMPEGTGESVVAGLTSIPASLSAHCDIAGLARLLSHLSNGPRVVQVERMTVQLNSALRGAPDMLQVTLSLRAPVVIE